MSLRFDVMDSIVVDSIVDESSFACRTKAPRSRNSSAVKTFALFRGNSFSGTATILLT